MSEARVLVTAVGDGERLAGRGGGARLRRLGARPARLLIDVGGRPPRPTLVASAGARELEERLAVHLPELRAASRGQTCHLAVAGRAGGASSACARRCRWCATRSRSSTCRRLCCRPPCRRRRRPSGVLLAPTSPRTALPPSRFAISQAVTCAPRSEAAARWVPARRALFGVLRSDGSGGLAASLSRTLLESENSAGAPVLRWLR